MRSTSWAVPLAAAVLAVAGASGAEPGDSLVAGQEEAPAGDSVAVVDTEPGEANEKRDQPVYRIQLEGGESVEAVRVETAWETSRYSRLCSTAVCMRSSDRRDAAGIIAGAAGVTAALVSLSSREIYVYGPSMR